MPFELSCDECGNSETRNKNSDTIYCSNCHDTKSCSVVRELKEYTVIIEVDGSIDHKGSTVRVSGVTGKRILAENEGEAESEGLVAFKENPDYNTDISVNKQKFPDGRYLDDWGYDSSTARVIDVVPAEEYSPLSVKWKDRGRRYCTDERPPRRY